MLRCVTLCSKKMDGWNDVGRWIAFYGMGQLRWATLFTRRFSCPSSFVRPADQPTEVIVFGKQKDGEGFFGRGLGEWHEQHMSYKGSFVFLGNPPKNVFFFFYAIQVNDIDIISANMLRLLLSFLFELYIICFSYIYIYIYACWYVFDIIIMKRYFSKGGKSWIVKKSSAPIKLNV